MHQKPRKLRSINDEEVQHSHFGLIGHFVSCFTQRLCISQSGERTPERFDEVSVWEVEAMIALDTSLHHHHPLTLKDFALGIHIR